MGGAFGRAFRAEGLDVIRFIDQRWLDFLYRHAWLTFILMGLSFLLFGYYSVNLFVLLKANVELILEYGMMAMADGAAQQLAGNGEVGEKSLASVDGLFVSHLYR